MSKGQSPLTNYKGMENLKIVLFLLLISFSSCNTGPKPIDYGSDGCHFCSMTIVDQQHAAEIVTKKGKVFKFDSSECMMNHVKDIEQQKIALFLVNDYGQPGKLIDATKASFLISSGIPSPMGEFLTAFETQMAATKAKEQHKGEVLTWEQLKSRFHW